MALTKVDTQLLSNGFTTDSTGLNTISGGNTKILATAAGTDRKLIFQNEVGTQATLAIGTTGSSGTLNNFYIQTNAGYSLNINASGLVTHPFVPSFKAGLSTSYTPGSGVDIIFNSVNTGQTHFNSGGYYSTTTGRFTAPIAGKYFFTTEIIWMSVPNNTNMADCMYIYKNGGNATYSFRRAVSNEGTTTNGSYYTDHANCVLDLAAGDYVTVRNQTAQQVHGNTNYTWFAGYLIG